jgi:hypothetical protein
MFDAPGGQPQPSLQIRRWLRIWRPGLAIGAVDDSAVINRVVAVPLLILILPVANNRAIIQTHTNCRLSNGVGFMSTPAMMGAAAIALVVVFFQQFVMS